MKEKKYHESTETIHDRGKMNLAGYCVQRLSRNYFEPCHEITSEPERLFFLPHQCVESVVCPLTDIRVVYQEDGNVISERRRVVLKSDSTVVSTNRPRYICS